MSVWKEIQKLNFTNVEKLCHFLELDAAKREKILAHPRFALNLPLRLAQKIKKNSIDDPIFLQFVPLLSENEKKEGFTQDPVKDANFRKARKLLQKYPSRALLIMTSACVMNCRFCFRKAFDYERTKKDFEEELSQISENKTLREIILSGGDPLSLSNEVLKNFIEALSDISHIKRIRFHTRFPIGIPERIDEGFINILQKSRLQTWFMIHTNHPLELDDEVLSSLKKLKVPLLSQTVLLKGVNDSKETLKSLFEKLVDHGIAPYYLNQLDKVEGSHPFEVSDEEGKKLIEELTREMSGYAIPKFVREIPGRESKTLI